MARVCRARVGERVEATDGRGARAALRLVEVRRGVVVEVEGVTREPGPRESWVLCGAPEGDRADWLVEKLAELGVGRFLPVDTVRGRWRVASGRRARWERLAIAALRQSRRLHLMAVEEPVPLQQGLNSLPPGSSCWLADVSGAVAGHGLRPIGRVPAIGLIGPSGGLDSLPPGSSCWLADASGAVAEHGLAPTGRVPAIGLIGPSGGLDDGERQVAIGAGFQPLRLSDARLRTETAALAWAVWWSVWGQ